ncbi:hypothetical protein HPP92_018907 [Vanilla planifolia]|uniref:Uncharacterized protein n=1 Tax=Vanilla planifolia TaxID=51239 RepID=A0A835Q4V5_VANPL|nr:hypothetical protein HPP92_018907 [Vanilla planifolia]
MVAPCLNKQVEYRAHHHAWMTVTRKTGSSLEAPAFCFHLRYRTDSTAFKPTFTGRPIEKTREVEVG